MEVGVEETELAMLVEVEVLGFRRIEWLGRRWGGIRDTTSEEEEGRSGEDALKRGGDATEVRREVC